MPDQTRTRYEVRWLIRRDMPEVLQIEQLAGGLGWNEEDIIRCLGCTAKLRSCSFFSCSS